MSECSGCGRPLRDQDNFCSGCGVPVPRSDRVAPEGRGPSIGRARRLLRTYPLADRGWRVAADVGVLAVIFAVAIGLAASLMRAGPAASDERLPVTPSATEAPTAAPAGRPPTVVEPTPASPAALERTPALAATPTPTTSASAVVEPTVRPALTASPVPPTPAAATPTTAAPAAATAAATPVPSTPTAAPPVAVAPQATAPPETPTPVPATPQPTAPPEIPTPVPATPQATAPPETPTPVPAAPLAGGAVRSEWIQDLIVAAVPNAELPALLAGHRNAVLGAPYPPGLPVWTAYRLSNLRAGQQIRREWVREDQIVAQAAIEWSDDLPTVWRASLARYQMRGGRWDVRVWVDDQLAAVQPFEVDAGVLAIRDVRFSTELLADGRPSTPTHSVPFGVPLVFATFSVFNAPANLVMDVRWVHNGRQVEAASIDWPGVIGPGSWQPVALPLGSGDGPPLAAGDWRFVAIIDGAEVLNDVFRIEAST